MKSKIIEWLGGYPTIEDAIEAIKTNENRTTLLTLAVKKLFNTIGSDDILKEDEKGNWMYEGKTISPEVKKLLIAEAHQLQGMNLWKVLQSDVKYQINRKMFLLAENDLHLTAGKLWLFTFDAFKTRLSSIVKGSGSFNKK
jgi:hypothetical protein